MSPPKVFISAASADLGPTRQVVKEALLTIGCHPVEQNNFPPDWRSVTQMLREKIGGCQARRVDIEEIEKNDYNLNISRYVSTAKPEPEIDLADVHAQLGGIDERITEAAETHNQYLKQLGLPPV